jgi:hypothetical protein
LYQDDGREGCLPDDNGVKISQLLTGNERKQPPDEDPDQSGKNPDLSCNMATKGFAPAIGAIYQKSGRSLRQIRFAFSLFLTKQNIY